MLPAKQDLVLYRGDSRNLSYKLFTDATGTAAADLTGATVLSQIRARADATDAIDLTCAVTLPNEITVTVAAADTRRLPRKGVWDLQITYASGDIFTLIGGKVTVMPDVTKPATP